MHNESHTAASLGQSGEGTQPGQGEATVLTFVRGSPTSTEIAAVVAVLAARARASTAAPADGAASASASRSGWSDRSRLLREPITAGPGGWRRSVLPQ